MHSLEGLSGPRPVLRCLSTLLMTKVKRSAQLVIVSRLLAGKGKLLPESSDTHTPSLRLCRAQSCTEPLEQGCSDCRHPLDTCS